MIHRYQQKPKKIVAKTAMIATVLCFSTPLGLSLKPSMVRAEANHAQRTDEEIRVKVYEQASPAVVQIIIGRSLGSGFIVRPDGLVLTNAHVVSNATSPVKVILANGRETAADILGFEGKGFDLAALKIRNQHALPTLRMAKPGSTKVGQSVYAIGSPQGLQNTFTAGIISRIDPKQGLIQHDASINPGNSGGPLLNSNAEAIGVNTSILTAPIMNDRNEQIGQGQGNIGIAFAIAVEPIQPFLVALQEQTAPRVAQRPAPAPQFQAAQLVLNGKSLVSKLGKGDEMLPNNSYFKIYAFEGKAGQKVNIQMSSKQVDSNLFLLHLPSKKLIAQNDDISAKDFSARVSATLPESGVYVVLANAYEGEEAGEYQIWATTMKEAQPTGLGGIR
jgi:serine protease Do